MESIVKELDYELKSSMNIENFLDTQKHESNL